MSLTSQELASSTEEMNASTEQVSAAIQQISKGAQSQAAQVDETAKVMAEMSSSVIEVVRKSELAAQAAGRANDSANMGEVAVESAIKKMQEISKVVDESAQVIESLGKRSEEDRSDSTCHHEHLGPDEHARSQCSDRSCKSR